MKRIVFGVNVVFFTDNKDVGVDPQSISKYMTALAKFELIPSFGSEFNPAINEKRNFLRMVTSDEHVQVNFGVGATNITIRDKDNVGEISDFLSSLLSSLNELTPFKKSNRLSVITSTLISGSFDEYSVVFGSLYSHHDNIPFEWDYRAGYKIDLQDVELGMNKVITCRKGMNGAVGGNIIDSIVTEVDINTPFENQIQRYSYNASIPCITKMLNEALDVNSNFIIKYGLDYAK